MFVSEKQGQKHETNSPIISQSDNDLFEELESIGPSKFQIASQQELKHHWTTSFLFSEGTPELPPLREVQQGQEYQVQPSLFCKLSAEGSQSNVSQASSEQMMRRRVQNDTKNIPKNFGKGILNFILKNQSIARAAVKKCRISYAELMRYTRSKKGNISTIAELRELWTDGKMGQCMRMLSNIFLRKHSLSYIFNSRILSFSSHVKYRTALWEALHRPKDFNHIKMY